MVVSLACERPHDMAVRVSIPGPDSMETPVTGVGIVALPYDRDSVLGQLRAKARLPHPDTTALDSIYAEFRGPFTGYSSATFRLGKLRDSLAMAQHELDSLSRDTPRYSVLYARFGRLTDSIGCRRGATRRKPTMYWTRLARPSSRRARVSGLPFGNGKIAPIEGTTASCTGCPAVAKP